MACKLEAQGKEGKIVFVDGSPDMTKYLGKGLLDGDSYQAIENNFLFAIAGNNAPTESIPKIKVSKKDLFVKQIVLFVYSIRKY